MAALSGVRVVDFSQVLAGPYCTMLLADLGADVIKVESPANGDISRGMDPKLDDTTSGAFLTVNRNKRSISADLKSEGGRALVLDLVSTADVLVENFRPGVAARLGLDFDELAERNSRLVYCSISGFGQTGPYSRRGGFDLIAQGMSGLMSVTGEPDGTPVKCGPPITDLGAGMFAVYGILAALAARERTGRGQRVDTSLLETGLGFSVWEATEYFYTGRTPRPTGSAHRLSAPYQAFRCADGHITVGADGPRHWPSFCAVIGLPELAEDPRYATNAERLRSLPNLVEAVEKRMVEHDREHWLALLEEAGIPAGPIYSVPEALEDQHARARDMVVEIEHPRLGTTRSLGPVVKFSDTPAEIYRPAPDLGEHTDELARELGRTPGDIETLRAEGALR
ncbi:CaiB/BaiF CoA transferase family protein [Nocardiopsis ansamitocini]|uniref:CoA transferase n=1 Tax=Nocardiopsis ansamitocini TaxID=1670832 RepID=A0A9W6P9S5_9ACTN|nr:CoA transferase [Nocardiopsis ansamitocini]GLU49770.1 CoA transferase [Nocardiopsis ansamitocini]